MLAELKPYITDEQINEISSMIQGQFRDFCLDKKTKTHQKLYLEEYAPHKSTGSLTWALQSSFPSDKMAAGLQVKVCDCGGGHVRPELFNDKIIIHVVSNTADFKAKNLQENYYALNANGFGVAPVYCYLRYAALKNDRLSLHLCLPDKDGKVVASELLFETPEIKVLGA